MDQSLGAFIAFLALIMAAILALVLAFYRKLDIITGPATLVLAIATLGRAIISYNAMIELRQGARTFVGPLVTLTAISDQKVNVDVWRIRFGLLGEPLIPLCQYRRQPGNLTRQRL